MRQQRGGSITILLPPSPDPSLFFFVFELQRWLGYQKCSKAFRVFDFFGSIAKFCILQALTAFKDFAWKKNFEKKAKFSIFTKFWAQFKAFYLA